ncbi:MAG: ATP-binding protein [Coriobacteriales bacterium]|jgi:type II secretory pathway predicted ATPase ExeA|nr:ATP-binding protein [Coriobacteriales bacterium]
MYNNPFTPVFGSEPLYLAGRKKLVSDVLRGLENGPGDPNRTTVFTGARGSGKTVLLSHIASAAEGMGWIAAQVAAGPDMLLDLMDQVEKSGREFLPAQPSSRLSELTLGGFGAARELQPPKQLGWRAQMESHLDALDAQNVGLLFTVDEVKATEPDLIRFVSVFQFFVRDRRNVALLMAGLPGNVVQMLRVDSISFMRRAFQRTLDPLQQPETRQLIRDTVEATGRSIDDRALRAAANATSGLPFLIQLIGYHAFNQSNRETISLKDTEAGIIDSREDMRNMVLNATLNDLSEVERRFLHAMALDERESRVADIAARLGESSQYVGTYRRRLISQGVIAPAGRGKLTFAMPMLRELLLEDIQERGKEV